MIRQLQPGKVFLHIGPFSVRRGMRYPGVIMYEWNGHPFLESGPNVLIINSQGKHEIVLARFPLPNGRAGYALQYAGRMLIERGFDAK